MRRAVVTGASGFIGQALVRQRRREPAAESPHRVAARQRRKHGELVAARARDLVVGAHHRPEHFADSAENVVADRMAFLVVDRGLVGHLNTPFLKRLCIAVS